MLAEKIAINDEYIKEVVRDLNNIDIDITASSESINDARVQINLLHKEDDGFVTIAVKQDNKWMQYHYKQNEINKNIGKILSIDGINIYLSPNSFYKPFRRIENIRKLNALYIDLDYYTLDNFKNLTKEQIIWQLENYYFKRDVPEANFIVITGRGLAIYWLIEPVPYKALPLWNAVQKYFLEKLKEIGADEKSIDSARVMRLAGGVNQKNGKIAELLFYNDKKYILRDIQENYLPDLTSYVKNSNYKPKGRRKRVVNLFNLYSLHYARFMDLIKLLEFRKGYCRNSDYELEKTGQREFICFLYRYWSCCYTKDFDKALEDTLEFNNMFVQPLDRKEVIKATKKAEKAYEEWLKDSPNGIYKRGGYNYKNETLIEKLNITIEEMALLQTIISKAEVKRRNNEYNKEKFKRQRRNENGLTKREQEKIDKINRIEDLRKLGLKQTEIADRLGITQQAVSKLFKNLK